MPLSSTKLASAIKLIKCGKAQSSDNIPSDILKHCGPKYLTWLQKFCTACMTYRNNPRNIAAENNYLDYLEYNYLANQLMIERAISPQRC